MSWELIIKNISVEGLHDTGSWRDKQDPALTFTLGDTKVKTKRSVDTGTSASYVEEFVFKISEEDYNAKELVVEAHNEGRNSLTATKFISSGKQRILHVVPQVNSLLQTTFELQREGASAGTVTFSAYLSAAGKKIEVQHSKPKESSKGDDIIGRKDDGSNEQWKLEIEEITVSDLFQTGTSLDKQDPMVKMWVGDKLLGQTKRIKDAPAKALFPERFSTTVTEAEFMSGTLKIEVFNEGLIGSTHVGVGSVRLRDAVPDEDINDEAEVDIQLTHESSKGDEKKGFANFFVFIDAPNRPVPSPEQVQAKIKRRELEKVQAKKADNKKKVTINETSVDTAISDKAGLGVPAQGPQRGDEATADEAIGATAGGNSKKPARGIGKTTDVPFSRGNLHVVHLSLSALASSNKMRAVIELGNSSQCHETTPEKPSDGSLSMDFLNVKMDVERHHIHGGAITVKLYEETLLGGERLVGSNAISLDSLLLHVDDSVNLTELVRNERHEKRGEINMTLRLEQLNDVDTKPAIEVGFSHAVFEVGAIKLMDLRHTDSKFGFTKVSRPFVTFMWSDAPRYTTNKDSKPYKGGVIFDHLTFEKSGCTPADIKNHDINLDVFDQSSISSKPHLVGSAVIGLDEVRLNKTTALEVDLTKNGKVAGAVTVFVSVNNTMTDLQLQSQSVKELSPRSKEEGEKMVKEAKQKAINDFIGGRFVVKDVTATGLTNVEAGAIFGDKQDPYVTIEYDNQKVQTECIPEAGTSAFWKDVYGELHVHDNEQLIRTPLIVSAWDKNNTRSDKIIGKARILLSDYILEFDDDNDASTINTNYITKVKLELFDDQNKRSGQIVLSCMMKPSNDALEAYNSKLDFPDGFEKGVVRVSKIVGRNLSRDTSHDKSSEVVSPFLMFDYLDNSGVGGDESGALKSEKSGMQYTHIGRGSNPSWAACGYKQSVTRGDLSSKAMTIMVRENADKKDAHNVDVDNDKVISVGVVPNLLLAGSCPGKEVEVDVDLFSPDYVHDSRKSTLDNKTKRLGHLTLYMTVDDTTGRDNVVQASPRADGGEEGQELEFTEGLLCISYLTLKGMRSSGHPYVSFMVEDAPETKETLPVLRHVKGDLYWDVASRIPVDLDTLQRKRLEVTMYEQSALSSNKVVGHGSVDLKFFASSSRINKPVELSVQLMDDRGRSIGRIILGSELRPLDKEAAQAAMVPYDEDFNSAVVHFYKIQTHNLKNTELVGKQDPYVKIIDNDAHEIGKTFTLFDKGGSVLFDWLDIKTSAEEHHLYSKHDIETKTVTIEAWDANTGFDTFIGSGVVRLKDLAGPYGREVELMPVHLIDKKGNTAGRINVFAKLEEPPPPKDTPIEFPEKFTSGNAFIRRIGGFGLKNVNLTGFLGNAQDPYVCIELYPSAKSVSATWRAQTAPVMDSGEHALWDYTDMEFPIDKDILVEGELFVVVKDKNVGISDKVIGSGSIGLKRAVGSIKFDEKTGTLTEVGSPVELSIDLDLEKPERGAAKKKGKADGRIVLHVDVARPLPKEEELRIEEDFDFGTLYVNKVRTFDLRNTELMNWAGGQQDPYVKMKFGDWSDETHPKEDAGSDVLWDFLAMETPVYIDTIQEHDMEVSVYDQNSTRKDVLIGKGRVKLTKAVSTGYIGEETKVTCSLTDDKNRPSGRVEVYVCVKQAQMGGEVPSDFDLGILTVHSSMLLGTKGKCSNPNLSFSLNDATEALEQREFGADEPPRWAMNWKTQVDKLTVRGANPLVVTVTSSNFTGGRSVFGTAHVDLSQAAMVHNMSKEVQLSAVVNSKDMKVGRLVLLCSIKPDIVKSLPVTDGLPKTFVTGTMIVHNLKISGDVFDKKKVYCKLEHGKWNESTVTATNNGARSTSWDFSQTNGFLAEVNKDSLKGSRLQVTVMEEKSTLKKASVLASGFITPTTTATICSSMGKKVKAKFELHDVESGGHMTVGAGEMRLTLTDEDLTPDDDDGLPDSAITFKSAIMQITKISAIDLHGGDLIGRQDPFVVLSIDNLLGEGTDWKAQTAYQEEAGRSATWDAIDDITTPVSADAVRFKRLRVVALDHNKMTDHKVMGVGDVGLRGVGAVPNESKVLTVKLKDGDDKNAGKVEITMKIIPDVDMSSGIDADGDGIDDGLEADKMQGFLDVSSVTWNRGGGWESDQIYPTIQIGGWKAIGDIQKSEGNKVWEWGTNFTSKKINSAHVSQYGLRLIFRKASNKHPSPSDTVLGDMKVVAKPVLATLGEWVDIKGDFIHEGEFRGKMSMTTRFTPTDAAKTEAQHTKIEEQGVKTAEVTSTKADGGGGKPKKQGMMSSQGGPVVGGPQRGDQAVNMAGKFDEHEKKMGKVHKEMEASMKAQMKQMIDKQTEELRKSMEELELKALRAAQSKPVEKKKDKLDIFNVTNVELPPNVNDWRNAHVQAWLAFVVELPEYMDSFNKASIDGHMLLKHVDDKVLHDNLGVTGAIPRQKVIDSIEKLKERQEVLDKKTEALRRATLRKEKAEDEAELRKLAKDEAAAKKKADKKSTKTHKKQAKKRTSGKANLSNSMPALGDKESMFGASAKRGGVPSEQNQIDRVRLERAARAALLEKQKLAAKMENKSRTWRFEYTGAPEPSAGGIWDDMAFQEGEHPEVGTKDYQRNMLTLDPLDPESSLQQGVIRKKIPRVRSLPHGSTGEEVLAAVKSAFYRLSSRLLEVQKRDYQRTVHADDDLLEVEYSVQEDLVEVPTQPAVEGASATGGESVIMASPGGGDQDTPPPATGTTESTTDYDKAPPIEEWQNDADKKDYMKAQPNIEEGGWAVPPPPDAWDNDQDYQHGLDEDEIKADPKLNVSITVPTSGSPVPPAESPTKTLLHRTVHKYVKKPDANTNSALLELQLDRMRLVYNALVNQTNNNAPFIGTNDKLTRLKLFGGLESICRLKLSWAQFDSMWTKLDSIRTGDLDLTEFKNFFGDLSEFEAKEGLKSLTLHNADASMQSLAVCLADMCDVMRHAGFTVEEMFCCFDRNGNGTITPSEFCSLLRLIIGPTFDKKIVYEALMTLDTDRDKAISRYELFMFVYRTWKMQLEEIDYRKSMMDPEVEPGDARRFNELNKERNQIREALRRNFNRELRDLLEAQGATQLAGPFATLLAPNSPTNPATAQNMADSAWFQAPGLSGVQKGSSVHKMSMSADFTSTMPLPSTQEGRNSTPGSPARSQSPHRSRRSNTHGQIMRFKIKAPGASSPHRPGKTLTLPKVNAVKPPEASNQAAAEILKASAPVDNLN